MSLSYSAHLVNAHFQQKAPEEVFADHAVKIYKKENERHWRRIGERLEKVGIGNVLVHMRGNFVQKGGKAKTKGGVEEEKVNVLDEKYFRSRRSWCTKSTWSGFMKCCTAIS